jgi:hypothetical protein
MFSNSSQQVQSNSATSMAVVAYKPFLHLTEELLQLVSDWLLSKTSSDRHDTTVRIGRLCSMQ